MPFNIDVKTLETLGVCVALTVYFVLQSTSRELRMAKRLTALEEFVQTKLVGLVESASAALNNSTEALRQLTEAHEECRRSLRDALRHLPCATHPDACPVERETAAA